MTEYKGWIISCICPPIPIRSYDYQYAHARFDESTELMGFAETEEKAMAAIDEMIEEGLLEDYETD